MTSEPSDSLRNELPRNEALDIFRMMLLIRRFEERATQYFLNGQIRGSFHPGIGQEATAVGGVFALRPDDYMLCTYRGHAHSLAKGLDPKEAMAELLGKRIALTSGQPALKRLLHLIGMDDYLS